MPDRGGRDGAFNVPRVPDFAAAVPSAVMTLTPMEYRNPGQLAESGALVVGASATGVQIAYEIQRSGRPVTLAVGEHVRGPRLYRGRDIHWWMEAAGVTRRALRRGGRHRVGAARAVDAARGVARTRD